MINLYKTYNYVTGVFYTKKIATKCTLKITTYRKIFYNKKKDDDVERNHYSGRI